MTSFGLVSATKLRAALALAVSGVLALLIGLAWFAHPSGDDFCYAVKSLEAGFVESQRYAYEAINGRYAATAGIGGFALLGEMTGIYAIAPVLILLLTFAAFAFLVSTVARERFSRGDLMLAAGVLTIVYFSTTPDPAQTFYWLSGAFTYQLGNILFVVLAALLVVVETRPHGGIARRIAWFVAASACVIAAIGTNEVTLVLTSLMLASGTAIAVRRRRATRYFWLALSVVAVVAAAISILSPGNFFRAATIGSDDQLRPGPLWAALAYLPWVLLRMLYWLSNLAIWASAFVLFLVTRDIVGPVVRPNGAFARKLLLVPAVWLGTIFVLHAIGFVANRYPLPERAESVVNLAFLLGWYPSFVILAHWALGERSFQAIHGARFAAVALFVGLLGSPTIFDAYKDVYRGYRYDREMQARWEAIRLAAASGSKHVVVPSLSKPPRTLFATDIVTDPKNFRNACMAEYFGLESIRLGTP